VVEWIANVREQLLVRHLASPSLVIVDTLARNFVGGNENSAHDMGRFVEGVERVRADLNTAVHGIHHSDQERRCRSRQRSPPQRIVRNVQVPPKSDTTAQVRCSRMKEAREPGEFHLTAKIVEIDGGTSTLVMTRTSGTVDLTQAVRHAINSGASSMTAIRRAVPGRSTVVDATVRALVDEGIVIKREGRYEVTVPDPVPGGQSD
jgi:AAA domain